MRIAVILSALALTLTATTADAKPNRDKRKTKEATRANPAAEPRANPVGEQGEEPSKQAPRDVKAPEPQQDPDDLPRIPGVTWKRGPTKGDLGNATIDVPAGFAFTGIMGTRKLMEAMQNEVTNLERGTLWKIGSRDDSWLVVFEYEDSGHIKDDDKDDLKADEILKNITEGNEAGNDDRRKRGWLPLHVIGWQVPPHYDEQTHNLEWATKLVNEGHEDHVSVNYNVRLLGRTGYMSAILLANPEQLIQAVPEFKGLLANYIYTEGSRYGDFKQGDKLAEYGIAALIAGGGLAVAAKAGLLGKFVGFLAKGAKVIIIGVGAAIAGIFKKLKGGSKSDASDTTKQA